MTKAGKCGNMSFYIGQHENGYIAEVESNEGKITKEFLKFPQAVKWVERQLQKQMRQNEIDRNNEEA